MRLAAFVCAFTVCLPLAAVAQEPPPKLPPFVLDFHATVPRFPAEQALADSRGLTSIAELPGAGLGLQIGAHLYFFRWRAITFGIGGEFAEGHASQTPPEGSTDLVATTERFRSLGSQLSFNFGNGFGWSYISGGIGTSTWALGPTGAPETPQDTERL